MFFKNTFIIPGLSTTSVIFIWISYESNNRIMCKFYMKAIVLCIVYYYSGVALSRITKLIKTKTLTFFIKY